jgi:hypothetical protein
MWVVSSVGRASIDIDKKVFKKEQNPLKFFHLKCLVITMKIGIKK